VITAVVDDFVIPVIVLCSACPWEKSVGAITITSPTAQSNPETSFRYTVMDLSPLLAVVDSSVQVTVRGVPWISIDPLYTESPLFPIVGNYVSVEVPYIVILTVPVIGASSVPMMTLPVLTMILYASK